MSNVTNEQLIFLDNLIYLDFEKTINKLADEDKRVSVGNLIEEILNDVDEYIYGNPACMSQEEWANLLTSFRNNSKNEEFLNSYVIENYESHSAAEGGFRGCCFVKRDSNKKAEDTIVIFRGTSTNETEWTDNVLNANKVWSDSMDDAVLYIDGLSSEEYGDNITVSGHSKGGNRAQYVTILRKDRIGSCVSFDGQGFSSEFIRMYEDEIAEMKSVITSISFVYDYVNALLYPIAGEIMYIPGESDDNYSLNHCPNRVFNENGEFNTIVDSDGKRLLQILCKPPERCRIETRYRRNLLLCQSTS